ncbi:hypothetical protein DSM104299_03038 [Baekduia alba]|uniref:zf-HC2 domain-containing protein n=1 Tax=Baekduia alba TaxID=2997333 RepID=UPI0023400DC6|nr:hypothetical protein [Baekduia alba]WCB94306.1 hypothetical protein DSM104299_03038 [Baekduia alba]
MAVTEGLEYMPLDGRLGSAAMEGSSDKGVTPQGVRAGDRVALQALVDRRGPAVIAFCTQVCGPQNADRAAAEAFARFRAAVRDAPDLTGLDPEALLRGATRHAAASMARQPSGPPPHGRLRSRGTQTCEHVPTMLAARANGALGNADLERLARHLERCERCDALGEIFRRAELAYQDPVVDTLGTDTSSVLLDALEAVPEHGHAIAPAPASDAVVGEALTGAFPTLPELDDEVPIAIEVAHVEEPATELHAADLTAEPLPDAEPEALAPGDEDLGLTVEWDNELPAVVAAAEAEDDAPAPVLTGGHTRRSGIRPLAILLPLLLVIALAAGAAALAGVFNGDDGSPAVDKPPAPHVQAPVTTPLPIKIKQKPAPAASASTATPSDTTAPDGTAATGPTDATGTTP